MRTKMDEGAYRHDSLAMRPSTNANEPGPPSVSLTASDRLSKAVPGRREEGELELFVSHRIEETLVNHDDGSVIETANERTRKRSPNAVVPREPQSGCAACSQPHFVSVSRSQPSE
jgi:hypothetical protein